MRKQLSSHFYTGIQQGPIPLNALSVDLLELHEYLDVVGRIMVPYMDCLQSLI